MDLLRHEFKERGVEDISIFDFLVTSIYAFSYYYWWYYMESAKAENQLDNIAEKWIYENGYTDIVKTL